MELGGGSFRAAPWGSRIRLHPPLKKGLSSGIVADIQVKGATEEEFRRLFDFYAKGFALADSSSRSRSMTSAAGTDPSKS